MTAGLQEAIEARAYQRECDARLDEIRRKLRRPRWRRRVGEALRQADADVQSEFAGMLVAACLQWLAERIDP